MALNTSKCNHLPPLHFKGLMECLRFQYWKRKTRSRHLQVQ